MKPDDFANLVAVAIKAALGHALAPILERLAAGEAKMATLTSIPDRVVTLETKSARPVEMPTVDLVDVKEQLATLVARVPAPNLDQAVTDRLEALARELARVAAALGERIAIVETKADRPMPEPPPPVDVTPIRDTIGAVSARVDGLQASINSAFPFVHERIDAVELKAARPHPEPPPPIDVTPILERMAVVDKRLDWLEDVPGRVTALELRGAGARDDLGEVKERCDRLEADKPAPVDLTAITSQLAAVSAKLEDVSELRDKVVTLETKAASGRLDSLEERFMGLSQRQSRTEAILERPDPIVDRVTKAETVIATTAADVVNVRERMAGVEARPVMQGPPGQDGKDGADGRDALDLDDFSAEFDPVTRALHFRLMRGDRVKSATVTLEGYQRWRGVFREGQPYDHGDTTTWGGSVWHCNEPTTEKPGEGTKAWTLMVKRGANGKDGRIVSDTLPVVKR